MKKSMQAMELSDDGEEIKVMFNLDDGDFWIMLNTEQAIKMATSLLKHAQEIKERNLTREKKMRKPLKLITRKK